MWRRLILIFAIRFMLATAATLDLSFKEMKKEDFFRNENGSVSDQVEKATELNLRGNAFDNFIDCSGKLDKVEILDLSQNLLKSFFFECKEDDNLLQLNVSHNKLSFLNDKALTKRISKLQILDLSHNIIHTITKETFQHLENLRYLSMSHNPIGNKIDRSAFRNLKSLEELHMCHIFVSVLPAVLFTPLVSLRHLSLTANPIESVPALPIGIETLEISGTNIYQLEKLDYPRLLKLRMNSMPKLESLDLNQLKKLSKLSVLSMDNCPGLKKLTATPPATGILGDLRQISVKNCSLTKLGVDVQPVMQRTTKLDLQSNPWHCDCGIKWILALNSTITYRKNMRCESPPELREKLVYEIPEDEFWCAGSYLALWLALSVIAFSGVVAALTYFGREPIRKWVTKSGRGDTVTYKNMRGNSNDTEKILEHSDVADYPQL